MLSNAIDRLNVIPIKLTMAFFKELEQQQQNPHNSYGNMKDLKNQCNLEKEEWNWRNQPSQFRLHYKAIVIKTLCTGTKTEK